MPAIANEVEGGDEVYCYLLSRIGSPVSEPQLADVGLRLADPEMLDALRPRAARIVRT